MDISDGPGVRVSIFMQGCTFNCKQCFNPETHDFNGGKEFTQETINRVLDLSENENKAFKEKFPNKTVWSWTGFLFDKDLKDKEVLNYIDVLVDGQYSDELRNPTLKYSGSSNQRVIDVQASLKKNQVVLVN